MRFKCYIKFAFCAVKLKKKVNNNQLKVKVEPYLFLLTCIEHKETEGRHL